MRERLLLALVAHTPTSDRIEPSLERVVVEAVTNPGALVRAELAWYTMDSLGFAPDRADAFACALEYFHTASLLFDDLPAMDDSAERRGRICAHLLHGEGFAMLGALALITRAYALLGEVISAAPSGTRVQAHRFIESCLGASGLVNGQAFDLNFQNGGISATRATRVALGKTVPMLRLALVLPALLTGTAEPWRKHLNALAVYWGLFYQGVDDVMDIRKPDAIAGKTTGRDLVLGRPNIVRQFGAEGARSYLARLSELSRKRVAELIGRHSAFGYLMVFQRKLMQRWASVEAPQ